MTDVRSRTAISSAQAPAAPRILYAACGVLAALAGIAVGHLVAALTNAAASPVISVGSVVIDLTPTPVKELVLAKVGTADKPILLATVSLASLALAALAGLRSRRRPAAGVTLLLLLVAAAGGAAMTRPTARLLDLLPAVATAVVGVGVLLGLRRLLQPATAGPRGSGASRRTFLVGAAGVTAGAAVGGAIGQRLTERATDISGLTLPSPATLTTPLPAGVETTVQGVSPFRTPTASFYRVDTNLTVPRVSVGSWSLKVDGDVRNPFTMTYDELLAMPMIERDITLTCVSNEVGGGYVGAARWLGVRLADVLDRAGRGLAVRPDPQYRRRRVHHQHAARRGPRRTRRHDRGGDERRAADRHPRIPRSSRDARAVRVRRRHEVADQAHPHDVCGAAGLLDAAPVGHRRPDQDVGADRHPSTTVDHLARREP